ncbi:MAG: RNA 2',3'-cyclic phosphodiesterase [Clostridiales bacterium]|jgi:2'-5' RNA ligase|nr:RNA 2',3'-cyclic phosphodiesterase [Clostridiales bacterium]
MRLFIAINFDTETKSRIIEVQNKLRECATGRFTSPENLHLTVVFLGEVEDYRAIKLCMDKSFTEEIELNFSGVGSFRSDIYWIGIKENPALNRLYRNLCRDLQEYGYKADVKEIFKPHITLAREVEADKAKINIDFEEFGMIANRLSLMKSERIRGKLTYTEIYSTKI